MKKILAFFVLTLSVFLLAACGTKTPEEIIKTELQESYIGYSENKGNTYPFAAYDGVLTFDKENYSITNSKGHMKYFSILGEDQVPTLAQAIIDEHAEELKDSHHFSIIVSRHKNPKWEDTEGGYHIALSDGGKSIRIFELNRDSRDYGYYDFSGKAK
ncbi:hypothetical protein E5983_04770 [Streptococcus danieliae]|uniref:Lipoprotein n=1 Tax=Streptococcus danieliae TaxID=747656 RepID=A0A7X3KC74_9STRE|nr:hypothetical protein [Streptococcus danieliae]MVX58959.1 hypothetical protein [Streptococcus danieliae]